MYHIDNVRIIRIIRIINVIHICLHSRESSNRLKETRRMKKSYKLGKGVTKLGKMQRPVGGKCNESAIWYSTHDAHPYDWHVPRI